MSDKIHSTGRGGAGNIGEDNRTYVAGDIVREGVAGESSRPEYSAGRGGAGNIVSSPRVSATIPRSEDVVPETATRPPEFSENFHTGRGGAGNFIPSPRAGTPASSGGADVVPETATRQPGEGYENYHTGRGGEGNIHKDKYGGHSKPPHEHKGEGLLEKAKQAIGLEKHKGETTGTSGTQ